MSIDHDEPDQHGIKPRRRAVRGNPWSVDVVGLFNNGSS